MDYSLLCPHKKLFSKYIQNKCNKLFNTKVTSTEEDFQAYNTSLSNFKINKLEKKIELFNQSSISNSKIVKKSPYDLIIANILFLPIINFSPLISNISKKLLSNKNTKHMGSR